jgi:hypothetical protein
MHYMSSTVDTNTATSMIIWHYCPNLLLPYEHMYIQLFHHNYHLIPEQYPNEQNPMFQLLYDKHHTSHPHDI